MQVPSHGQEVTEVSSFADREQFYRARVRLEKAFGRAGRFSSNIGRSDDCECCQA